MSLTRPGRAVIARPRPQHTKTAVLVDVAERSAVTTLNTPFGIQRLRGPFYIVAEGLGSYGAVKDQFEQSHVAVGANRWTKSSSVLAYRAGARCAVETFLGNHHETTVIAEPDDWIVQQQTGRP